MDSYVIMYADVVTDSMQRAISETNRRRNIQEEFNLKHGWTPRSVTKKIRELIKATADMEYDEKDEKGKKGQRGQLVKDPESMNRDEILSAIKSKEKKMRQAAAELQFEQAAAFRDEILEMKKFL